jgi:cell wall-associated NlpC family hydrolase
MERAKVLGAPALALALFGCFASAPPRARRPPPPAPPLAKAVIRTAKSYLAEENTRKKTPRDCSDFVQKVFAEHGIRLPRTSEEMSLVGTRIRSSRDLRMGDLVFFSGARISRIVGHVGIYVNKGIFIHLTHPEDGVTMDSMYNDYFRRRYITARRVIP